jgi:two-component system, chemotaxis family, CheB/CheR fusion protein
MEATSHPTPHPHSRAPVPVVGIGASAGGLEALEEFFRHVPPKNGFAFVVVQHLDPTHKDLLSEILQRATSMKVTAVSDGMPVKPNCVFVIPPDSELSLAGSVLHLSAPAEPRGHRLPIDGFFRSLAEERREHSVGVVLSGMGSDGTLGLKAIKERGGLTLVQEPAGAKFDSMPRSAIDAGAAEIVAPAAALGARLTAPRNSRSAESHEEPASTDPTEEDFEKILTLLRAHSGHDFSLYKRATLYRRIERRMGIHQLHTADDYVRILETNGQEVELLFKELLIGVTNFFREPEMWQHLADQALPALLATRPAEHVLRVWVAGCSTGEEAYSVAMIITEAVERCRPNARTSLPGIQIFATELDKDAIEKARRAVYPQEISGDVSPERLHRFFVRENGAWRVRREIRDKVIFAPQNLIMDPPFTKLDLLFCRNVLIYLAPEVQKKLLPLFHYSLNPGGILVLGSAETIGSFGSLFSALAPKSRTYQRRDNVPTPGTPNFPTLFSPRFDPAHSKSEVKAPVSLQSQVDQLILKRYAPSAVLVGEKGDIVYVSGSTGHYLEPAAGKANWNIFAMARQELRHELSIVFKTALTRDDPVTAHGIKVGGSHGHVVYVDLTVHKLSEPESLRGLLIVIFTEIAAPPDASSEPNDTAESTRIKELQNELNSAATEAQATREEMQMAQEELRSTNEELQSANEELTSSKEEMQSLNEELQTVNTELQTKVDDLSRTSSDMMNLLNSTNVAAVFLDNALLVRRFTPEATKIIKLITGDIGRPVTDLASSLEWPELESDAHQVLQTHVALVKIVASRDERWFSIHLQPYRTTEGQTDGLVITFTDITLAKLLERKLRAGQTALEVEVLEKSMQLELAKSQIMAQGAAISTNKIDPGKRS